MNNKMLIFNFKDKSVAAQRLQASTDVASCMVELAAKKIEIKLICYSKKLKLIEDNSTLLSNINVLFKSYFNVKSDV
jgi:hypothetical protein